MTLSPIVVRVARPEDFVEWEPLWKGYNRFYGRHEFPREITQMTWSRFFDAYEPVHALVAERTGRIVGLAHYLFHRSTIQIEPTCYLQDLYTEETSRNEGVGRALIGAVYAQARNAGSQRVYWQTHESNVAARKLYDKMAESSGFVVYRKQLDAAH